MTKSSYRKEGKVVSQFLLFPVAGCAEAELSFVNPRGERLCGLLLDTGSPEVVLLCHGYIANYNMCQFPVVAATLAQANISSFRFDHAMAYTSKSERKSPFLMGNHQDEVRDYKCAVEFMSSIGKKVVCILGHSKGGINTIIYAATHSDVPKMINLSGRFKVKDGVLQRFGKDIMDKLEQGPISRNLEGFEWTMSLEDFKGRFDLDMDTYAKCIPPTVKVLTIHGTNDTTIPYQESEYCTNLIQNTELKLIEGADHNFTKHGAELAAIVTEFVKS